MASGRIGGAVAVDVGRLFGRGGTATAQAEGALLDRFRRDRDPAALEALIERHGPMVLGVCRRALPRPADAEDAFQATFLVLARRAGTLRDADRLGPWLHGVARRVAARARARVATHRAREQSSPIEPAEPAEAQARLEAGELRSAVDDELARLPEKLRVPLVLCYLEGLTHDEAAAYLGWPVGTVRSRMATGRDRLRDRLTRRGFGPSAGLNAVVPALVPSSLVSATTQVATATAGASVPATVALLAQGVLSAMFWKKLSIVAATGLAASVTLGSAGVLARSGDGPAPAQEPADTSTARTQTVTPTSPAEQDFKAVNTVIANTEIVDITKQLLEAQKRIKDLEAKLAEAESRDPRYMGRRPVPPRPPATPEGTTSITRVERKSNVPNPLPPAAPQLSGTLRGRVAGIFGNGMSMEGGMVVSLPDEPMILDIGASKVLTITVARDRATIHDLDQGTREEFVLPTGVTEIQALMNPGLGVVLTMDGARVDEIVVITSKDGKWHAEKLREPATQPIVPVLAANRVSCRVGRYLYIFRAEANRWNVINLE